MNPPERFYKYVTFDTARIVLESMRLRWSSPLIFDDVAEFRRMPRFYPSIADVAKTYPRTLVAAALGEIELEEHRLIPIAKWLLGMVRLLLASGIQPEELLAELGELPEASDQRIEQSLREFFNEDFISTARVLCVAPRFDNSGLWENYADTYRGCVLEFCHIPELDTPLMAAQPVAYSREVPVVGSGLDFLLYGGTQAVRRAALDAVCFAKKEHWAYQEEWRAVTWRSNEGTVQYGDYKFFADELESVTFGPNIAPASALELARIIRNKYPKCVLYKLKRGDEVISRSLWAGSLLE